LEQLFLDLKKDPMTQACWISHDMNKVVIARTRLGFMSERRLIKEEK
jgi:hypothetical protein